MDKEERIMKAELEYMEKFERGEAPSLEELVETYPDMREELADFVLDYVSLEAEEGMGAEPSEEALRAAAAARESALEKVLAEPESLVEARKASGERLGTLALAVNVPRDVLSALEDGVIFADSVSAKLSSRLGRALGLSPELVRTFLSGEGGRQAAVHLRATRGPGESRRMTFEEALRASPEVNSEHLEDWLPDETGSEK